MSEAAGRFVRVEIHTPNGAVTCWGWLLFLTPANRNFVALWAANKTDRHALCRELGIPMLSSCGLEAHEVETVADADETNTPGRAWAALAHWRLTGERLIICERELAK